MNKKCVYKIGETIIDGNKNITILDEKKIRNKRYYKIKCNKCGFDSGEHYKNGEYREEYWSEGSNLKNMKYCPCCCPNSTLVSPYINSIYAKAPWMINLGVSEEDAKRYTPNSNQSIKVTCPDCGRLKECKINNINSNESIGCNCGDGKSYISKYIFNLLFQLEIKFNTEVKYDWNKYINPLTNKESQAYIDFIIYKDDREIPLEADGAFHRSDNKMNGMTKEQVQNIDKQRDENCLKYLGEETIRISDEGDIKENILNSKLNEVFDLRKVDWLKCEEFALSNLVKEVCEYKKENPSKTTTEIGKIFGFSRVTILNWLKQGSDLKWCDYDAVKEVRKSSKKSGLKNSKKVEVFKDGVSLGIFNSCMELERQSEEKFGVKLNNGKISKVCNGERNHHKGLTFKYV